MENSYGNSVISLCKGVASALALSFVFALVFALVLRFVSLPNQAIYPTNQVLKGVSLCVGVILHVRGEKGWLKGGACGLLFAALSYLLFSGIANDFSLSWLFFGESALTVLVGAVSGSLAVNMRRA